MNSPNFLKFNEPIFEFKRPSCFLEFELFSEWDFDVFFSYSNEFRQFYFWTECFDFVRNDGKMHILGLCLCNEMLDFLVTKTSLLLVDTFRFLSIIECKDTLYYCLLISFLVFSLFLTLSWVFFDPSMLTKVLFGKFSLNLLGWNLFLLIVSRMLYC